MFVNTIVLFINNVKNLKIILLKYGGDLFMSSIDNVHTKMFLLCRAIKKSYLIFR